MWNLDGTKASEPINVLEATRGTRPQSDERFVDRYDYYGRGGVWKTIVRDCSWHPSAPVIAATSWNGWDHGLGTCTVHSWNDGEDIDEVGDDSHTPCGSGVQGNTASARYKKYSSLGSTPMGARVTAQLHHDERFYGQGVQPRETNQRRARMAQRMGLGAIWGDDSDEE